MILKEENTKFPKRVLVHPQFGSRISQGLQPGRISLPMVLVITERHREGEWLFLVK